MDLEDVKTRGLVLLGCGKMGSAMLSGWLAQGVSAASVWVMDPHPSDWLKGLDGLHLNDDLPPSPAVLLIAVKPQMMGDALPSIAALGGGETLFISVAAGTPISAFEAILGAASPIVRAMPNTPAAIGHGITAIVGNDETSPAQMDFAEHLLTAVGQVVRLENEEQLHGVIGVSGSGPAYVFNLIEALAAAGEAEGLPADLAMQLAKATVGGAGELAEKAKETPAQLRVNVSSPGGTTLAALGVLMDEKTGLKPLLRKAVKAAADRSRELAK